KHSLKPLAQALGQVEKHLVLVVEVPVEGAVGHRRPPANLGYGRPVVAALFESLLGHVQEPCPGFPAVAPRRERLQWRHLTAKSLKNSAMTGTLPVRIQASPRRSGPFAAWVAFNTRDSRKLCPKKLSCGRSCADSVELQTARIVSDI